MKPDSTIHQLAISAAQSDPKLSQALLTRDGFKNMKLIMVKSMLRQIIPNGCIIEIVFNYHLEDDTKNEDVYSLVEIDYLKIKAKVNKRKFV